jgi:cytochrome c553/mono/diheme cytochrome c family protein
MPPILRILASLVSVALVAALVGSPARAADPVPPSGSALSEQSPLPRLALKQGGGFLATYGQMLFESPEIMGTRARELAISCATCHNRGDANPRLFVPGLSARPGGIDVHNRFFNPIGDDGRVEPIDIPSLRGIRSTAPYGRDGRIAALREFAATVIVTEFDGPEPTTLMLDALTAFLDRLDFLPAPALGPGGRLNGKASAAARRGEALFHRPFTQMDGRSCASCHVPDRYFVDGARHDIGSGDGGYPGAAFDTPTLLGTATTAPYFHDGALATLAEVVAWFDRRYGLGLNSDQKSDLTAYIDAVGKVTRPYESFSGRNTRFALAAREDRSFLATLDPLIARQDRFHALLLVRSVARDLRDEAPLAHRDARPLAAELANRLDTIGEAIRDTDWAKTAALWKDYRAAYEAVADRLN